MKSKKQKPKISHHIKSIAILNTPTQKKKKSAYDEASLAIQKKLDEIKTENEQPSAAHNNLLLFRYEV